MRAHEAVRQMEQVLRGIAAACNRSAWPEVALAAQNALVALDSLDNQLEACDLDDLEFEPIKSTRDLEEEADECEAGT